MSETPKQKAIREAYGIYWNKIKGDVNPDGWIGFDVWFRFIGHKIDYECNPNEIYQSHRPFCLQGIENNNGWLSVVEHGLPKKWDYHLDYHVFDNEGYVSTRTFTVSSEDYWKAHVTHYQPIIKPKPPIY